MSEWDPISRLKTPVGDGSSFALGRLQHNTEGNFLSNLNTTTDDIAFTGFSKLALTEWLSVVEIEHVIATNMSDTATGRPGLWSWVAKGPDLNELALGDYFATIRDGVADEVSIQ
jgi:hypothetical protein